TPRPVAGVGGLPPICYGTCAGPGRFTSPVILAVPACTPWWAVAARLRGAARARTAEHPNATPPITPRGGARRVGHQQAVRARLPSPRPVPGSRQAHRDGPGRPAGGLRAAPRLVRTIVSSASGLLAAVAGCRLAGWGLIGAIGEPETTG